MQLPVTASTVGRISPCKAAISSLLFAITATSGCSSTPSATPQNPSLSTSTAVTAVNSNGQHQTGSSDAVNTVGNSSAAATNKTTDENQKTLAPLQTQTDAVSQGANVSLAQPASNPTLSGTENLEISRLKIEILSLRDKVDSLQRKFDLVLRSQRAGIFQVENPALVQSAVEKVNLASNTVPPLRSEGPIDPFDSEEATDVQKNSGETPQALVDRALIHLTQSDYAKVLQLLEDFQNRFPNNPLSSTASLALAEAYVELQSPQRALTHVRGFYLQHPNDLRMPNAKWFEARIHEQLRAPQKAAQLYREVIALAPKSELALKARASLEKIAEGQMQ
jgi:TolA-binding protein